MSSSDANGTQMPPLPPAPPSREVGHGYSGHNPVPTIQDYKEEKAQHEKEAERYAETVRKRREEAEARSKKAEEERQAGSNGAPQGGGEGTNAAKSNQDMKDKGDPHGAANEKTRMMDQMNANKLSPTQQYQKAEKGERRVRDPITDGEIIVKDVKAEDFDSTKPAVKGSSVLHHVFPPPRPPALDVLLGKLKMLQLAIGFGMFVVWVSCAFGSGIMMFVWRSVLCGGFGFAIMTGISLVDRGVEKEVERVRQDMHRQRALAYAPPLPESVEWLNGLIQLVWGLVDPSMFISIADMVEDIMQQSLPGFVDAVRITDIGQGTNPLRITHIRALPDQPTDEDYPKTDWINEGDTKRKSKDTSGKDIDEDEAGDYYNFEVAFSYAALPGEGAELRVKNIHLLIEFFIGMFDWLHIPIPIWIQVEQIFGIVRLRVQFIPEFPFVRNLTFALCGVPDVEVSAIPLSPNAPNVLDLPFVANFVKMGIAAGTSVMCVPKSMTINLQEMLSGAAVGDTRAKGVFIITIHHCEGLSAQDNNGLSDPYVVLAYAKFGKPLYSTRIILGDLNPVFEETAFLMVSDDEIKAKEDLSAMLWDSDKMSADDLVGRVQIPVTELMKEPNQMIRREDSLMGFEDANDMPGKLVWSIGYFEKAPLKKELERSPTKDEAAQQQSNQKTAPEMEMMPHDAAPNPAKKDLPPPPPDVQKTRPDPQWPSGILSIILHQVNNFERQNLKGKSGNDREGEAGQDTDVAAEQTQNLPSGYGEFLVNDEMVYKTRVKQYSTNPYFEAGTEVFIRDFEDTVVRIVIRDSRLREGDPIMGIVSVRLSEVFAEASSVTQVYALTEGVGFGKANISFAFRAVQATLPKNLRGWNTGTVEVSNISFTVDEEHRKDYEATKQRLRIVTTDKLEILPKKEAEITDGVVHWDTEKVRLPVYNRYQSSLGFGIGKSDGILTKMHIKDKPDAAAVLWMQDLTDDVEQDVKLPVVVSDNLENVRQNVLNDQTKKHHDFKVVGYLSARIKLDSGLDEDHETMTLTQSRRHALEAYDHIEGEAEIARKQDHFDDDGVIDKQEQKEMDKAHKRQLESRGRGPAQFKAYRQAKWMAKGVKDRMPGGKPSTREPSVQTEA